MSNQSKKLLICFYILFSTCHGIPSVTINQGALEGVNLTTENGRNIFGFLGVPYAQPPLGDLRFKAPQPASSWNGTYSATDANIQCSQLLNGEVVGEEDCLHLNVYTPQLPEGNTTLLPVMVYIYGGGFIKGSARITVYGPKYLLDHDVVLVTMNYRVGSLGFLTTGDEVAPGNFGLKDQILALHWVQDNIAAFGGDPGQVTIFGNSAGSTSVHILTLSDLTEGLFHQFIIQSGTGRGIGGYLDRSTASLITMELATSFNCSTDNSSVIVKCLREQNASSLISWSTPTTQYPFPPTNEPESDEAVITDSPKSLTEQGKMWDLPWIGGIVSGEGLVVSSRYYFDENQWDNLLVNFKENVDAMIELLQIDDVTEYSNAVMEYYFNDLTADKDVIFQNYTDFVGDLYFAYSTLNLLEVQERIGTQSVYMYLLDYQGVYTTSYEITGNSTVLGTCHGDEVFYLFHRSDPIHVPSDINMTETDLEMMKRMTGLWTSFAINGVPRLTGFDDAEEWLEYDENKNYLHIGNASSVSMVMESALFEDRMHFWRELLDSPDASGSWHCSFDAVTLILTSFISFIFIK